MLQLEGDRVSAEHHECRAGVVRREQQIAKIFRKLDQVARLGTNLQGMLARV